VLARNQGAMAIRKHTKSLSDLEHQANIHQDRIWQNQADLKENEIYRYMHDNHPEYYTRLVDSILLEDLHEIESYPRIISDTWLMNPDYHPDYHCLAPEIWHIFLCDPIPYDIEPSKPFCCVINRVSGERLLLFYKMARRGMIEQGLINFNCGPSFHNREVSMQQRLESFDHWHQRIDRPEFNDLYELWRPRMPLFLQNDDVDLGGPDWAAMSSRVSIIMETYHNRYSIVFSEKIFRALQTPRPWVLFCSHDSVKLLRDHGFDVLDDLVDHGYDSEISPERRMDLMLDTVYTSGFDAERCRAAVSHNQEILSRLSRTWSDRLAKLNQSISSRHHSLVNRNPCR
jgi:hypothetical protein